MHWRGIVFFVFISVKTFAQESLNFAQVDSASYALYENKEWKTLSLLGKEAKKSNIDFYYLRMRLAIANNERKRYRSATNQFEAAKKFYDNETVNEYLYYNYLNTDRYDEALRVSKRFSAEQKKRLSLTKIAAINMLLLDGGAKIYSAGAGYGTLGFLDIGLNHRITRGYSLYHQYSFLTQRSQSGGSMQHQYCLTANIPLVMGFVLSPTFHLIYTGFQPRPDSTRSQPTQQVSFGGSISVLKHLPIMDIALINSFSNLYSVSQIQHSLQLSLFPLYNQKLSLTATAAVNTQNYYSSVGYYATVQLQYQITPFLKTTAQYYHGNMSNALENNGTFVNNNLDVLKGRFSFIPDFTIKKRYHIFVLYQLESKTQTSTGTNYINHTISLGTKLLF